MGDVLYRLGLWLEQAGIALHERAFPRCAHRTGIARAAFFCADCGAMRSQRLAKEVLSR